MAFNIKQLFHISKILTLLFLCLFYPYIVQSETSHSSGCALDLDLNTINYDDTISLKDIETQVLTHTNASIRVGVIAQNVMNLDTYQVEILFNPKQFVFIKGEEDNISSGLKNILKKNGGQTLGFSSIENSPGVVTISNALSGQPDESIAPEGSGIIAILHFKVQTCSSFENNLSLSQIYYLDHNLGEEVVHNYTNAIIQLSQPIQMDMDGNCRLDLIDVILMLQQLSHF
jgi:hypothetical protein